MVATEKAVEIAQSCLEGETTPLQADVNVSRLIGPPHPIWDDMGSAHGPLSAFYAAAVEADRVYFLGSDVERWHPAVIAVKQAELAEAEARAAPLVHAACKALIDYLRRTVSAAQNS